MGISSLPCHLQRGALGEMERKVPVSLALAPGGSCRHDLEFSLHGRCYPIGKSHMPFSQVPIMQGRRGSAPSSRKQEECFMQVLAVPFWLSR